MPLTDKDIAQDLLNAQKMSTQTYNTLAYESSNENLKRDVLNILQEEHLMHTQVFSYMNQRGWYEPRPADRNDVQLLAREIANAVNVSGAAGGATPWTAGATQGTYGYGGFGGGGGGFTSMSPGAGFGGWTGGGATQVPNPMSVSLPSGDQMRAGDVNYGGQTYGGQQTFAQGPVQGVSAQGFSSHPFGTGGSNVNWATATGNTGSGSANYGQQTRLSEGIMRV